VSTAAGREFYSRNHRETSPEMADLQYISSISAENRFIVILLVSIANLRARDAPIETASKLVKLMHIRAD